jgi:tetratricopeptide (TPR) repeat protein
LLLALGFRQKVAVAGALVYAVHYLFSSAVIWIPARGDLLLALFTFSSMMSFIRLIDGGDWKQWLFHLLFFTAALFSKETAVVLPILFGMYLWGYAKGKLLSRKYLLLTGYYLCAELVYFRMKNGAVADSSDEIGFVQLLKNLPTIPEMMAKFFVPVNISTIPAYQTSSTVLGSVMLLLVVLVGVRCRAYRSKPVLFAATWFFLFIIPGMTYFPNFLNFGYEHNEHRSYLVCFGIVLLLLHGVQVYEVDAKKMYWPIVGTVLVYLVAINLYFSGRYRNPLEFARLAIKTNPNSALAYTNFGAEMLARGDEDAALSNLSQAIRICRQYFPALHHRAWIYRKRGLNREALADLDTLLATAPDFSAEDYYLRGVIKTETRDFAGARQDFLSVLRLDPGHDNAKLALQELGRVVQSVK